MSWKGAPKDTRPWYGFVYLITNMKTGKSYIGKKFFWKNKHGKKTDVPSDWKTYWGSCNELAKDIKKLGKKNFSREIMYLCETRWGTAYKELELQVKYDVLRHKQFYNGIIRVRLPKYTGDKL